MAGSALALSTCPAPRGDEAARQHGVIIVPGLHCAGCIARVEGLLGETAGITHARVNLTEKLVSVAWRSGCSAARFARRDLHTASDTMT